MSTDRESVADGGGGGPKQYFCYQCNDIVTITVFPSSSADLVCPTCTGGFLEEYENPNPPYSQHQPSFFSFSSSGNHSSSSSADWNQFPHGFPFLFGDDGHGSEPFNPADITAALLGLAGASAGAGSGGGGGGDGGASSGGQNRSGYAEADVFNPIMFLQNYLNNLRAGGANIQFVIENNGGGGGEAGFRLPSNLGDYFIGPGLEQLIQQLAENDPNRYGTPPASKEAVEELPDVNVSDELLASDNAQCAVCMDTFELGGKAKQMPCKHIYHPDCILPWLELHNSCPVCRYELPTDDPEYEQHATGGQRGVADARVAAGSVNSASAAGSGGASEENSQSRGERMFRVQLPWPFNSFGSGSDGSNSGSNNDNENFGGRSHQ